MVVFVDYRRMHSRRDARLILVCEGREHDGDDGERRMRMVDWSAIARAAVVDEWMPQTWMMIGV
jgi:hypothetical protein